MGDDVIMTDLDEAYGKGFADGHTAGVNAPTPREQELEAALQREREAARGLVEALEHIAKDTVIVYGWNENHKKVPMGTKQTAMAVYASNVLATYNDNRKG
jgi:hypothetical protein